MHRHNLSVFGGRQRINRKLRNGKGGIEKLNKNDKVKVVEELNEKFSRANMVILFDYKGITVQQINKLRRLLDGREEKSDLLVIKNTMAIRSIEGTDYVGMADQLIGPNAILFGYDEVVPLAKTLVDFAKEEKALEIKLGMMGENMLDEQQVKALAQLPSRDELLAQLLATMQAPVSNLVSLFANIPRGLLNVLNGIKDKQEAA